MPDNSISLAQAADRLRSIRGMMLEVNGSAWTEDEKDADYPTLQLQVMRVVASVPVLMPEGIEAPAIDADRWQMLQAWVRMADAVDDPMVTPPSMIGTFVRLVGTDDSILSHPPGVTYQLREMAVQLVGWLIRRAEEMSIRKPLGKKAALLYEMLISLPEHRGMMGPEILDWFKDEHNEIVEQGALTKDIIPALKPYGLRNAARLGYFIPLVERPEKIS